MSCDIHRWELKGGTQSGALAVTLWQCSECGKAKSEPLSSGMGTTELYSGWSEDTEEPDDIQ